RFCLDPFRPAGFRPVHHPRVLPRPFPELLAGQRGRARRSPPRAAAGRRRAGGVPECPFPARARRHRVLSTRHPSPTRPCRPTSSRPCPTDLLSSLPTRPPLVLADPTS